MIRILAPKTESTPAPSSGFLNSLRAKGYRKSPLIAVNFFIIMSMIAHCKQNFDRIRRMAWWRTKPTMTSALPLVRRPAECDLGLYCICNRRK